MCIKEIFSNYLDDEDIRMEELGDDDLNYAISIENNDNEKEDTEGNFVNDDDKNYQNDCDDDEEWNLLKIQYGMKRVTINKVPTVYYYESDSEDETPPAPPPSPNFDNYF